MAKFGKAASWYLADASVQIRPPALHFFFKSGKSMNKKQLILKELRENDGVCSLLEARQIVNQKQAIQNLIEHSQKLGRYPETSQTEKS